MTAQRPEVLINNCTSIELDELRLYAVVCGDITSNYGWGEKYPFKRKPHRNAGFMCSALWRGYVAHYEITIDGEVFLRKYEYPEATTPKYQAKIESVDEKLTGDFYLLMKPKFNASRTYIPVIDGNIVCDKQQWVPDPYKD